MPYAANGTVSTNVLVGGIEITDEQYREAIDGMSKGMTVNVDDGFEVTFPSPPEATPEVLPTPEELRTAAFARRDSLLAVAALRMAPLQDAVDIGLVTAPEESALLDWKRYRVALSRIEQQLHFPGVIEWPSPPDRTSAE